MTLGTLYGVGVGPGDAELVTIKAARLLKEADVVFAPAVGGESESVALDIVKDYIGGAEVVRLVFPMTRDKAVLGRHWDEAAGQVAERLKAGQAAVFVTLGDPGIYSTYSYVRDRLLRMGYTVETIPGVASFSAGAAAANQSIGESGDKIAIIPFLKEEAELDVYLERFDTIVLMKAYRTFAAIKRYLAEKDIAGKTFLFSNVGMRDEIIAVGEEILAVEDPGYFTTLVIRSGHGK